MNIIAIIQARMDSSRLPGKMLMKLGETNVLTRVVNRTKEASLITDIVIATTDNRTDDDIESLCLQRKWDFYRGDEKDVLNRYVKVALKYGADAVVRITGDCPLIDAGIIDECVQGFLERYPDIDYFSNVLPRTYPRGLDVEVISISALCWQWMTAKKWREHVTLNIRNNKDKYRVGNLFNETDYSHMRWCLDNEADLEFLRKVYSHFGYQKFNWHDVIDYLNDNPELIIEDKQVEPK